MKTVKKRKLKNLILPTINEVEHVRLINETLNKMNIEINERNQIIEDLNRKYNQSKVESIKMLNEIDSLKLENNELRNSIHNNDFKLENKSKLITVQRHLINKLERDIESYKSLTKTQRLLISKLDTNLNSLNDLLEDTTQNESDQFEKINSDIVDVIDTLTRIKQTSSSSSEQIVIEQKVDTQFVNVNIFKSN
jgi:chromosome segregation ATPase